MNRLQRLFIIFGFFLISGWFLPVGLKAEEVSYDRYAPIYEDGKIPETVQWKKNLLNILAFPFDIVRWPISKTLLVVEKEHLDKKGLWLYEQVQNQGLSPRVHIASLSNMGAGVGVDFIKAARLKADYPDAILRGWFDWTYQTRTKAGGEIGWERIAETPAYVSFVADYENRPNEFFYGIGPDTSAGDGVVYALETTTLETKLGYSPSPLFDANTFFAYRNINVSSGRDGGSGQIGTEPNFSFDSTPGIFGDSLLTAGWEITHDTRNQKENSTRGGKRHFKWSFNEGLHSSEARYFHYQGELSQYLSLGSERRVLVLRAYGEHNDEIGDGNIPFHRMAKLGGHGVGGRRLSQTLRGYEYNRFYDESQILFNLEYRYAIWEYRQLRTDAVLFWDEGQVFGEFGDFEFKDFKESYGLGLRLSIANVSILSVEVAHGDEGTNFYFKSSAPF